MRAHILCIIQPRAPTSPMLHSTCAWNCAVSANVTNDEQIFLHLNNVHRCDIFHLLPAHKRLSIQFICTRTIISLFTERKCLQCTRLDCDRITFRRSQWNANALYNTFSDRHLVYVYWVVGVSFCVDHFRGSWLSSTAANRGPVRFSFTVKNK